MKPALLTGFEWFSVAIFTIEYFLRLWTADKKYPSDTKHPYLKYIISPMAVIDFLATFPFYLSFLPFLPFLRNVDFRFLRVIRLLRVFKLTRYFKPVRDIGQVLKDERPKLLSTIAIIVLLLFLASSSMYYIENAVQPDEFPNIIATFWWAVATLTTVGYGDVYPVTILGKILSGIIAILGIAMVALPSGIIAEGFRKIIEKQERIGEAFDAEAELPTLKRRIIEDDFIPSLQELEKKYSFGPTIWDDIDGNFWFGFENNDWKYVYIIFQFERVGFRKLFSGFDYIDKEKTMPKELEDEIGKLGKPILDMLMSNPMDKKYRDWDKEIFVSLQKKDNDVIRAIEDKTIELLEIINKYDL